MVMNLKGYCNGTNKEKLRLENQQKKCLENFFHPTKYMYPKEKKKEIKN
jgi:hypothetical protein